jgi:acetyl-CoA synthetase
MALGSKIVWRPNDKFLAQTNLKRFMDSQGISSFPELRKKSVEDPEWFWDAVSKFLEIQWFSPYSRVVDVSKGIQWPKWFTGGKVNIAYNCLDRFSTKFKKKSALIYESESEADRRVLTFSELNVLANKIANLLRHSGGISKGDKVGLFMPMTPEAVASYFAVVKIGAIVVPIFSGYGKEAVVARLRDCDAKVLISGDRFSRRGKPIEMLSTSVDVAKEVPSISSLIICADGSEKKPLPEEKQVFYWNSVIREDGSFESTEMDSEDPFMIIYTSGTTGKPKGAVHVHGGFLVKIAEEVAFQADLHGDDILFWFTDMGWIMAPWEFVGGLALGGTILIYNGAPDFPQGDRLWQVVERNHVTKLGVSPTLIRALMKYGEEPLSKHNLTSLQAFGSTGEPWDPESYYWLFEKVGKSRCPIVNLSGGTEVAACFLSVHPVMPIKSCSLGGPCLGIDADVVDEMGHPIIGQTGELVVRNVWPSMTRGLWKDGERYIETYWSRFQNLWLHGDWASIDEDGYWFLHGRSDDTIKVAGKRVGPGEIESGLSEDEAVLESVAIGIPDTIKGEAIMCFVVLRPAYSPSDDLRLRLANLVAKELGEPLRPFKVKFVSSLPKTRNAKLVRRLVRARYLGRPLGDVSNIENPDSLEAVMNAI